MATKTASKNQRNGAAHAKTGTGDSEEESDGSDGTRRALWSGSISFGLLQIPVSMHTAEQSSEIHFHQLDRHDLTPIHYQRENASTGKPVEWKDIVRGYEHAKGEYVVIDDADLAAANVKATQTIDLEDFVDEKTILPMYFERPYFLAPGKRADKAYALFRDALQRKNVVAIGTVVIRTRQHLCAILPQKNVLILELLRFAHDLRDTEGISLPKAGSSNERELAMAEKLIESMRSEWKPQKYRDSYRDDVLALIARKVKTGKVMAPPKQTAPRSNVVDLMSLLRKSIEAKHGNSKADTAKEPPKAAKRAPAKRRKGGGAEAA